MSYGTNPFEDSFENKLNNTGSIRGKNPFDDDAPNTPKDDNNEDDDYNIIDNDNLELSDMGIGIKVGAPIEASWQYLGDLPYRRVPIYSNIRWGDEDNADGSSDTFGRGFQSNRPKTFNYGLSSFPKASLQRHPELLDARELRELLNTSTATKVVGCQYGGPIAAVTLPIMGETTWFSQTEIRIMTNSGRPMATIAFPSHEMERNYSPSDILEIGFTDRTILVIVLKDSLCLTYDLSGEIVLPPFFLLPHEHPRGIELFQACIFDGGVVRIV